MILRQHKISGFTLIELIVVIILVSVIAVIASSLLSAGLNAYLAAQTTTDTDWQMRLGLETMTREIRNIRSSNDILTANSSQLTFFDNFGTLLSYWLVGNTLVEDSYPLANGVSALTFTYYNSSFATTTTPSAIIAVQINMTFINSSIQEQILLFPRNLGVPGS